MENISIFKYAIIKTIINYEINYFQLEFRRIVWTCGESCSNCAKLFEIARNCAESRGIVQHCARISRNCVNLLGIARNCAELKFTCVGNIENRIYREEFTRKKCKTANLLYCFHTAGVLHTFMLYKLVGPGISFYRKSKIIVKRKPNYEIGWFNYWQIIISHRLYAFHFTNDDFSL